jgi:hypothetical protein
MTDSVTAGRKLTPISNPLGVTDANIEGSIERNIALLANLNVSPHDLLQVQVDLITDIRREVLVQWTQLKAIVERHEATLRKRWMEMTVEKRQQLLLSVWPHMPPLHRPDFVEEFIEPIDKAVAGGLWPFINLEDLTDRKFLMTFINSKSRSHPEKFSLTEFGYFCDVQMFPEQGDRFPDCRLQLVNELTEGSGKTGYGCVFMFPDIEAAAEWERRDCGCNLTEGLLTLLAQHGIYSFLARCCEQILHDITPADLISHMYPVKPEPPSLFNKEDNHSSFADAAKRLPYVSREKPDFPRLRYLISAAFSEARDHFWLLREDPSYFKDTFESINDHRAYKTPLEDGCQSELTLKDGEKAVELTLENLVRWSYEAVIDWDIINEYFTKLEKVWHTSTCDKVEQASNTLLIVYLFLHNVTNDCFELIETLTPAQPTFRRYMHLRPTAAGVEPRSFESMGTDELDSNPVVKRVHSLLSSLGETQD